MMCDSIHDVYTSLPFGKVDSKVYPGSVGYSLCNLTVVPTNISGTCLPDGTWKFNATCEGTTFYDVYII